MSNKLAQVEACCGIRCGRLMPRKHRITYVLEWTCRPDRGAIITASWTDSIEGTPRCPSHSDNLVSGGKLPLPKQVATLSVQPRCSYSSRSCCLTSALDCQTPDAQFLPLQDTSVLARPSHLRNVHMPSWHAVRHQSRAPALTLLRTTQLACAVPRRRAVRRVRLPCLN